jgi:hypothetical protein
MCTTTLREVAGSEEILTRECGDSDRMSGASGRRLAADFLLTATDHGVSHFGT